MPARPRLTPAKIQQAIDLFAVVPPLSRNEIARRSGVHARRVSELAAEHGHSFEAGRARMAKATEAIRIDNAARRASIVERQYKRIEAILARLEAATFKTILKGESGVDETHQLDFVPTTDERNLADAMSRLAVSATKLEAVDAAADASRQNAAVDQWLAHMTGAA